MAAPEILLASASPRRARLMREAGYRFRVAPTHVDETLPADAEPWRAALDLARHKAEAVPPSSAWVLAADTLLDLSGQVLGKPADAADAARILSLLSGRSHDVVTGVALLAPGAPLRLGLGRTRVTFRPLEEDEIQAYVATGEPLDKAGAYAVQGGAARFVARLEGPLDNVVGLPMDVVGRLLREARWPG